MLYKLKKKKNCQWFMMSLLIKVFFLHAKVSSLTAVGVINGFNSWTNILNSQWVCTAVWDGEKKRTHEKTQKIQKPFHLISVHTCFVLFFYSHKYFQLYKTLSLGDRWPLLLTVIHGNQPANPNWSLRWYKFLLWGRSSIHPSSVLLVRQGAQGSWSQSQLTWGQVASL